MLREVSFDTLFIPGNISFEPLNGCLNSLQLTDARTCVTSQLNVVTPYHRPAVDKNSAFNCMTFLVLSDVNIRTQIINFAYVAFILTMFVGLSKITYLQCVLEENYQHLRNEIGFYTDHTRSCDTNYIYTYLCVLSQVYSLFFIRIYFIKPLIRMPTKLIR